MATLKNGISKLVASVGDVAENLCTQSSEQHKLAAKVLCDFCCCANKAYFGTALTTRFRTVKTAARHIYFSCASGRDWFGSSCDGEISGTLMAPPPQHQFGAGNAFDDSESDEANNSEDFGEEDSNNDEDSAPNTSDDDE